jgi:hypothetical protein
LACAAPDPAPQSRALEPADSASPAPDWCEAEVGYLWSPEDELTSFPDDYWTIEEPGTGTGLRVHMPEEHPAFSGIPEQYIGLLSQLSELDGFGLSPGVTLRFSGPAPEVQPQMLVQGPEGWEPRELTVERLKEGQALLLTPWRPLPPGRRVVVGLRADPSDPDCISPALRASLVGEGPLADRHAEALEALGWAPEEVGALLVYTTQSALEVHEAVVSDIAAREISAEAAASCEASAAWRRCEALLPVGDYRDSAGHVPSGPPTVQETYELPVRIWLPLDALGAPWPTLLCGHGLGGDRGQCQFLADLATPLGYAVMAADAQEHGDHPARSGGSTALEQIMALFGFTIAPPSLDAFTMRDNFQASAWDRLQLLRAAELGWDVDGDGRADLDPDRMAYAGASLGGIMGPQVLHGSARLRGGVLVVPGGGMMTLVRDSETFSLIMGAMKPAEWDMDDLRLALPMVQTLIDPGDAVVYAAALADRRREQEGPDLALLMALDDAIVPNSSTALLAQASEVAGVGPELYSVDGVDFVEGPLQGNLADGSTGGLLIWAETQPAEGAPYEPADHSYLHESLQAAAVMQPFLEQSLSGAPPTLEWR